MNRTIIIAAIVVIAIVAIVILSGTLYTIDESEQVVITQLGKIIGEPVTESGLHWKTPFIQTANKFDKRLLDWEGEKTVIKTIEQKFIYVEVFARWRIIDPKLYLETVSGNFEIASSRLDAIIDPLALRQGHGRGDLRQTIVVSQCGVSGERRVTTHLLGSRHLARFGRDRVVAQHRRLPYPGR